MATVTGIEFEIKGTAEDAINSIHKLSSALKQLNKIGSSDMGLGKVAFQIKSFVQDLNSIKNIKSIEQMSNALKGLSAFGNAMSRAAKSVESVNTFVDGMSRLSSIDFTNLNEAAASIRDIVSATSGTKSSLHETSTGVSETANSASRATPILNRLSSVLSSLSGRAKSLAKSGVAGMFSAMRWSASGTIAPIKAVGSAISGLGNRLKRLIIMRTFRAMIRAVTSALKEGVNNLYAWSNAFGGEFASSMDRCSTALNYLKNSLGAVAAPIVNALAPALDFVVDKIVLFLNALNQLIAKLTGASYWTRAKKAVTAYGGAASDAISGAGSAAKDAMRYLAPFDEINKFPEDSGSGGGGGGGSGSGGTNASDLFEEMVSFDTAVTDFANMIKSAWEKADFTEVGNLVGTKLKNALDNINWSGIRETCNRIAHSIGTFINGFVETDGIWESIGSTVGEAINTAVEAINTFFETVHFDSIGSGLATALNTMFDPGQSGNGFIDPQALGTAISQKLRAAIDLAYGFLVGDGGGGFNFRNLGSWISQVFVGAFENIPFGRIEAIIRAGINGIFDTLSGFFEGLGFGNLATSIDNLKTKFNTFIDTVKPILEDIYNNILLPIANWAMENGIPALLDSVGSALVAVGNAASSAWKQIKPLWDKVLAPFMESQLGKIEDALLGLQVIFDGLGSFFGNSDGTWTVSPVADLIKQLSDPTTKETIKQNMNGIGQAIRDALDSAIDSAKDFGARLWNALVDSLSQTKFGEFLGDKLAFLGFSWEDLKLPVTAEITEVDQTLLPEWKKKIDGAVAGIKDVDSSGLKPKDKKISGFDAELMSFQDAIDPKSKEINDVKAIYKTSKDGLSDYYKTLNVTGRYKSSIDSLSSAQKTIGTTSKWSWTSDALSSGQKTLNTTSKWSWTSDNLSSGQKTLNTTSRWSWSSDALNAGQKTIYTTSDFRYANNNLSEAKVTFSSVAKFAKSVDGISAAQRTFAAVANFTKSINSMPASSTTINAVVKVVQGWKGTLEKALGIEWLQSKLYITAPKVGVNYETFRWYNTKYKYPSSFYTYYARGGIMNAATLLGLNGAGAHIAGEAGQEAILPLDRNTEWMDKIADRLAGRLSNDGNMTVQVVLDGKVVAQTTADIWRQQTRTGQNPLVGVI